MSDEFSVCITEKGFERKAFEKLESCSEILVRVPTDYKYLKNLRRSVRVLKSGTEDRRYFTMARDYWVMTHILTLITAAEQKGWKWALQSEDNGYAVRLTNGSAPRKISY